MKKKLKWICIIIVMLIIVALSLIYVIQSHKKKYDVENKIENSVQYEGPTNIVQIEEAKKEDNLMLIPRNFNEAIKPYKGQVNQVQLKKKFYKLIVKNIPHIYEEVITLNDEQIIKYYEQNTSSINEMNIYDKNEFVNICNDVKKTITNETKSKIPNSSIELLTCENTNDYYSFQLRLEYPESKTISIKVKLSNSNNRVEFEKYDELKEVYVLYNGTVTKQEVTNHLKYVGINGKNIFDSCKNLDLNKVLEFYDLNKSAINSLGVYSNKDYLDVTNQIVRIGYSNNPKYVGYTVKKDSIKQNEKYTSFQVNLNYSTNERLKLIVNLINKAEFINEENPKIKITAEIKEESE